MQNLCGCLQAIPAALLFRELRRRLRELAPAADVAHVAETGSAAPGWAGGGGRLLTSVASMLPLFKPTGAADTSAGTASIPRPLPGTNPVPAK
jgi:hypothetical protein